MTTLQFQGETNPVLEILQQGSGAFSDIVSGATQTITVPHSLGYPPVAWVFMQGAGGQSTFPMIYDDNSNQTTFLGPQGHLYYYVDSTNLYIKIAARGESGSLYPQYLYYIFRERAN